MDAVLTFQQMQFPLHPGSLGVNSAVLGNCPGLHRAGSGMTVLLGEPCPTGPGSRRKGKTHPSAQGSFGVSPASGTGGQAAGWAVARVPQDGTQD